MILPMAKFYIFKKLKQSQGRKVFWYEAINTQLIDIHVSWDNGS